MSVALIEVKGLVLSAPDLVYCTQCCQIDWPAHTLNCTHTALQAVTIEMPMPSEEGEDANGNANQVCCAHVAQACVLSCFTVKSARTLAVAASSAQSPACKEQGKPQTGLSWLKTAPSSKRKFCEADIRSQREWMRICRCCCSM